MAQLPVSLLKVIETLNAVPQVRWDRLVNAGGNLRVYGWVDRPDDDGRSDFVVLDFYALEDGGVDIVPLTSSVALDPELAALSTVENVTCQRVEDVFGDQIPGAIRLSKGQSS